MPIAARYRFIAVTCFLSLIIAGEARAEKKIGAFLFSSETRYEVAYRGFRDQLAEEGFKEPGTTFSLYNANGNKATASELVNKLAAAKMDLYFTAGTSASVALSRAIKDMPIVFSVVYDPVKAGIADSWENSGNNTTGTSTRVPMTKIMEALKKLKNVKKLAVLYSPGELNSEQLVRDLKDVQQEFGFKVLPVPLTKIEEFPAILPEVMRTSDAVYVTGSNLVDSQIGYIVEQARKNRVVTLTHLEDLVEKGVLFCVSIDTYQIGRLAGAKAARILRGAKPSSIRIESPPTYSIHLNVKTATMSQIPIPPEFMAIVRKKIQ